MDNLTPLPTFYKGVTFRSRLEARWAIYFDNVGIEWEYEKEAYQLRSGNYLPDFWLPQVNMWAEVKPGDFSVIERAKAYELAKVTGFEVLLLGGTPAPKSYYAAPRENDPPCECDYLLTSQYLDEGRFFSSFGDGETEDSAIVRGVAAAKAARFDNGKFFGVIPEFRKIIRKPVKPTKELYFPSDERTKRLRAKLIEDLNRGNPDA